MVKHFLKDQSIVQHATSGAKGPLLLGVVIGTAEAVPFPVAGNRAVVILRSAVSAPKDRTTA